jgi:hypothetical protein
VAGIMSCYPNRINRLRSAFDSHYAGGTDADEPHRDGQKGPAAPCRSPPRNAPAI